MTAVTTPANAHTRRLSNGDWRVVYTAPDGSEAFRNFGKRAAQARQFAEGMNKARPAIEPMPSSADARAWHDRRLREVLTNAWGPRSTPKASEVDRALADADAAREDADRLALEASNADRAARELEAEADAVQAAYEGQEAEAREYPVTVTAHAKDLVDLVGALEAGDLEAAKAAARRAGIYQAVA